MSVEIDTSVNPSPCFIDTDWQDGTAIIRCAGVLDMLTSPNLEREIATALARQPESLIVDLTEVEFLASCGMSALIVGHDECTPEVGFTVVADGPATSRPMEMIGLTSIIDVFPTVDAAMAEKVA